MKRWQWQVRGPAAGLLVMLAAALLLLSCGDLSLQRLMEGDAGAPLDLTPDEINLATGKSYEFTVKGGFQPYEYSFLVDRTAVESETLKYTAPDKLEGEYVKEVQVTARDMTGEEDSSLVRVYNTFSIDPASASYLEGSVPDPLILQLSGGVPPFRLLEGSGTMPSDPPYELTLTGSQVPQAQGIYTYVVQDDIENTVTATVTVTPAPSPTQLVLQPPWVVVAPGGGASFTASGGSGSYSWVATGQGALVFAGSTATYSAAGVEEDALIEVTSGSLTAQATVYVRAGGVLDTLEVSPSRAKVTVGGFVELQVTGGVRPYAYSVRPDLTGLLEVIADTPVFILGYTAPEVRTESKVIVTVTDQLGASADSQIQIKSK
jgi:hypothetical protein